MRGLFVWIFIFILPCLVAGQDDLLTLIEGKEEETTEYIGAAFKTNRVINMHSIESTSAGVMDVKISHRFGFINQGVKDLFGLDQAMIRIGIDLGLTDRLTMGIGRSSFEKTYDGYLKYALLRQSRGAKDFPFTLSAFASTAIMTIDFPDPERDNYFSSRLFYSFQLIMGRKFNESFSFQISPTVVHRNLVKTTEESNDVFAIGAALRQKVSKRIAINAEYVYVLPDQLAEQYRNSFSLGFDIETGGHVFQLHFTNSTSMIEKGYIAETNGNWFDGDIHFGFNISRVFTCWRREQPQ